MDRKEYLRKYREQHRGVINRNQRKRRRAAKFALKLKDKIFFVNAKQYHAHEAHRLFNEMVEKLHKIYKLPDLPTPLFLAIGIWEEPDFRAEAIPTKWIKAGATIAVFGDGLKWVGITTYDKIKGFRIGRNAFTEGHFEPPPEAFRWFEV